MAKDVYNPKEHAKADKALGSKKPRADEPLHAKDEGVAKPKAKPEKKKKGTRINRYGFLHVSKDLAEHSGCKFGKDKQDVPVTIERIEGGFVVKLKA